jgi:phenylacetic acid degradation operon negative regulatory protein
VQHVLGTSERAVVKPRSLVFDLYGDYVRWDGGQARLQVLVDLLGAFGVPASTARVVMARLRREGWLEARRNGRTTTYVLTDRSWRLLDEGRRRIFERERDPWDRQWRMVIYHVPESDRAARERLRKRLAWLGFGPLAPSTWVSPHDRLESTASHLGREEAARLDLLVARSRGPAADLDMARRCWDLEALQADFVAMRRSYQARLARYAASPPTGRDALVERISLVAEHRRLPFRDPDLPLDLLPAGWAGREVHSLFLETYAQLGPEAQRHYREVVATHS